MENSPQQARNLDGSLAIAQPIPTRPCLLVHDMVDFRRTFTVAARAADGSSGPDRLQTLSRLPTTHYQFRAMTTITAPFTAPSTAATGAAQAESGGSRFSPEQTAALSAPLDRAKVRQPEQGRTAVSSIEGWQVIAEANRIFGFDGWQRQTLQLRCIHQAERLIGARANGREPKPGWGVTDTARVRITVGTPDLPVVIREGCGAGHGIDTDLGQANESPLKEAETDAMKRALMTFGNPFGLALYDKQQREVTGLGSSRSPVCRSTIERSTSRSQPKRCTNSESELITP
jgi:hypothetical protein